jgi:hypothetical protein
MIQRNNKICAITIVQSGLEKPHLGNWNSMDFDVTAWRPELCRCNDSFYHNHVQVKYKTKYFDVIPQQLDLKILRK